jgi:iron(III) transport system substrate-binding protein
VVAYKGLAKPVKYFPPETLPSLIDNDFEFAANNRKRILTEWQKRYDSKSDPKN